MTASTMRAHDAPQDPPPARFAFGAHTWKEIAHLLVNLPIAIVGFTYVMTALFVGAFLSVTAVGLPLLALGLFGARLLGRGERARARRLLGVRIDEPSPMPGPSKRSGSFLNWLWSSLKDPVGWRTMLYFFIRLPWGVVTFTVMATGLFVLWPVLPFIARGLANADRAMVRGLLSRSDELERRIAELESDRGVVVDTAA
ncbi:sensor domain-containing protein, partial [Streptomyces silvensis]|uniref:sensor domain-containing protein n=1 Tax=Streptomyces silvensis TaxID=1765722 RepID=UPI0018E3F060